MSIPVDINDRLEAAALKAEGGSEIIRRFANDPAGSSIPTESGVLPSLAEWLALNATALGGVPALQSFVVSLQTALAGQGGDLVGWQRAPLADAVSTVGLMLSAQRLNIWEFAGLVVSRPTPADPDTWDWSPAAQAAFDALGECGVLEFTEGKFRISGVATSKTVSMLGRGAGCTELVNATAGATMFSYSQAGMSDKERRNWLRIADLTVRDEATFTGIGIKTDGVLCVSFHNAYIRDFKAQYGLQVLEGLWIYLDRVNSDLCEIHLKSTATPHNNNVIAIRGGEIRNPSAGRNGLYVENADIVRLIDSTIEGVGGGAMVSGGKFKSVKMLTLDNTYFEVLSTATEAGLVLDNCQAVRVGRSQLNSQSTSVPSVLMTDCDVVQFDRCVLAAFPLRATGYGSFTLDGCLTEGPMDIAATVTHKVISPMPYNTRAIIPVNPKFQSKVAGQPRAFANAYADSSFEAAAPSTSNIVGAPVSSRDTTQGYYDSNSWRVTGMNGDTIRTGALGVTTVAGQSGCMSFMAKADSPGRFTVTSFLGGAAGGVDMYLSTEWRRYFVITNLRPASVVGDSYLLQVAFQDTNAFNIDDVQFIPFADYGEIPGIIDGFNYIPTHGTAQAAAISREVAPAAVYFDRGISLRKMTTAPAAPTDGFIYYADGTSWNPGSGAGLYHYNGSTYTKL